MVISKLTHSYIHTYHIIKYTNGWLKRALNNNNVMSINVINVDKIILYSTLLGWGSAFCACV